MKGTKTYIKLPIVIIILTISSIPFWSCYYDSKEFLFPEISNNCDTANITYTNCVEPILNTYCYSCHGKSSGSSIVLEGYNNLIKYANNDGSHNGGALIGTITWNSNYQKMPQFLPKLDDNSLSIIQKWVDAGAPNN
jgi:hypothetical protein